MVTRSAVLLEMSGHAARMEATRLFRARPDRAKMRRAVGQTADRTLQLLCALPELRRYRSISPNSAQCGYVSPASIVRFAEIREAIANKTSSVPLPVWAKPWPARARTTRSAPNWRLDAGHVVKHTRPGVLALGVHYQAALRPRGRFCR